MVVQGVQKVSPQASGFISAQPSVNDVLTAKVDEMSRSVPLSPKGSLSPKERAFQELTGIVFNEEAIPSMEYLVYSLFEEVQELCEEGFSEDVNADFRDLDFILDDLKEQAPENLQPVLKKCIEIATEKEAPQELIQFLEKKQEGLAEAAFMNSEALGLSDEEIEPAPQNWTRIALIGTAVVVGLFALSYLFGGGAAKASSQSEAQNQPAPNAPNVTDTVAEAPAPASVKNVPVNQVLVIEAPAPASETTNVPVNQVPVVKAPASETITPPVNSAPVIEKLYETPPAAIQKMDTRNFQLPQAPTTQPNPLVIGGVIAGGIIAVAAFSGSSSNEVVQEAEVVLPTRQEEMDRVANEMRAKGFISLSETAAISGYRDTASFNQKLRNAKIELKFEADEFGRKWVLKANAHQVHSKINGWRK